VTGSSHDPSKGRTSATGPHGPGPSGYDAPTQGKPGGDPYGVDKAAKVLGRTPERIRQMLRAGQLEGEQEGGDPRAPWKVERSSVEAHRDRSRGHGREHGY
jgi:hypothetical protein